MTVFDIFSRLRFDGKEFTTGLVTASKRVNQFVKQTSQQLYKIGAATKRAGSDMVKMGFAMVAPIAISIRAAEKQNLILAQMEAVLKSTGNASGMTKKGLMDMASALQSVTNYSDETIGAGMNMLLTFTNIKKAFPEATKVLLDMSTSMGGDPVQNAVLLGKALNDPILGVSALREKGVQLSAQMEQQVRILVKSGRMYEAQQIILKELATETGGSAEAARKASVGYTAFFNTVSDLSSIIGNVFTPSLKGVFTWLTNTTTKIGELIKTHPVLAGAIGKTALALGGFLIIGGGALMFFGQLALSISSISALLVGPAGKAMASFAVKTWAAMAPLLPWIALIAVLGGAIAMIVSKDFRDWVTGIEWINKITDAVCLTMTTAWQKFYVFIANTVDAILTEFKVLGQGAKNALKLDFFDEDGKIDKIRGDLASRKQGRNQAASDAIQNTADLVIAGQDARAKNRELKKQARLDDYQSNYVDPFTPKTSAPLNGEETSGGTSVKELININVKMLEQMKSQRKDTKALGINKDLIPVF